MCLGHFRSIMKFNHPVNKHVMNWNFMLTTVCQSDESLYPLVH